MMLFVLILVCINGAQGCTYSAGHTVIVGDSRTGSVESYINEQACRQSADNFNARYNDPDLFKICRAVVPAIESTEGPKP